MLVDSHCHLDREEFKEDFLEILERAEAADVKAVLIAGSRLDEFSAQLELVKKYPSFYTSVGVHPHDAKDHENVMAADLIKLTKDEKVVGIGECGLDYFYNNSPVEVQKKVFIEHIKAAQETGLPLIVHVRDADEDIIEILSEHYKKKPFIGEIHCFVSSKKLAEFALEIGFYFGATGIITFKKTQNLQDIFKEIPLDRLLVETDAPFLAPEPNRGKRNEPAFVAHVAKKLAEIKGITLEELAKATTNNFFNLFKKASKKEKNEK